MNQHSTEMAPSAQPVVEDSSLPMMEDILDQPFEQAPVSEPSPPPNSRPTMDDVVPDSEGPSMGDPHMPEAGDPTDSGPAYLRLVVEVEDGELSVSSAQVVDGPLLQEEPVGEYVCQALVGGRPVGIRGLSDIFEVRGIAPPMSPSSDTRSSRPNLDPSWCEHDVKTSPWATSNSWRSSWSGLPRDV